jgi:hypothetical protein
MWIVREGNSVSKSINEVITSLLYHVILGKISN